MIIESFQLDFLLLLRKKYEGGSESQRVAIEAEVKVPFLWLLKKFPLKSYHHKTKFLLERMTEFHFLLKFPYTMSFEVMWKAQLSKCTKYSIVYPHILQESINI